ncbi:hypothetical protein [Pseudokineococcus lusitanus]|uniref:DUF559 domain-containing protein n=1 Tax=Pseudokineococcus lusitanus TaxID=763993 RepID=A0A3N1HMC4_9ACTN|nr:hypothetical protein [Pseudokineococcus lusitanus]ROP43664.1 hypothetical protein EDC03_1257 [Pseudokineococcus lusitanus]
MQRHLLPPVLEAVADAQARCVSRRQLAEHGVGPGVVARRVRAGLWQTAGPRCVVLHRGPLGATERRWAAVLTTDGVLGGLTALAVHGLDGWPRDAVEVVVPRSAGRAVPPWVRRRTTTDPDGAAVTHRGGLPVHRVERAALDAAAWSAAARTAGGLVAAVVQQRLTTAERLLAEADARGSSPWRHRAEVLKVLADVAGGSQALSEVDLLRLVRRHRLPPPEQQVRRHDAAGRVRYLDALWRRADGTCVLLEVDGVGHLDESRWYDDLLRAAEVAAAGDVVLRLPARALRVDAARVAALLRRHLGTSACRSDGLPSHRRTHLAG